MAATVAAKPPNEMSGPMKLSVFCLCSVGSVAFTATLLRAEALPPPVDPGELEIEVTEAADTLTANLTYQPPALLAYYSVLGQKLGAEITEVTRIDERTVSSPARPARDGNTVARFVHNEDFAASHPGIEPVTAVWLPNWNRVPRYAEVTLTSSWRNGQSSFELAAKYAPHGEADWIRGRDSARMFHEEIPRAGPVLIPQASVDAASRDVGSLRWWPVHFNFLYLPGAGRYFTRKLKDGRVIVYHLDSSHGAGEIRDFYPVGEVIITGSPGSGAVPAREVVERVSVTEQLVASSAAAALRARLAAQTFLADVSEALADPTVAYAFAPEAASASKLRYRLAIQSGLARTITWAETFTPEGATEPADYRFLAEAVSAAATQTQARVIDPFEDGNPHRFGSRPGTYRILPFDAALSVDSNNDSTIVPAISPITPYRTEFADTASLGADLQFQPNSGDDVDLQDEDPADTTGGADYANERVDGEADLAHFVPVYLEIGHLLSLLPPSNGFNYRLRQADGALNFVFTNLTQKTAFGFRGNPDWGYGPNLDQPARAAMTQRITASGVQLFEGETGSTAFRDLAVRNGGAVILIEARRGTTEPLVLEVSRDGQVAVSISLALNISGAQIRVDANRDGKIESDGSDELNAGQPFRMWVNDDDDEGDVAGNDVPGNPTPNYLDDGSEVGEVNGNRDLVDFFPVFIDVSALVHRYPDANYILRHAEGALNFTYTSMNPTLVGRYHVEILDSGFGDDRSSPARSAITHRITAAGHQLNATFLTSIAEGWGGVLLIEGRAATTSPLILSVVREGQAIAELELPLRVSSVESMFRHVDLTRVTKEYNESPILPDVPAPPTRTGDCGDAYPDSSTNGKYFVFLHGYKVDGQRARGWQSEVFKRLYQLGSRSRFVGVSWHGATGLDYHKAVFHAFQTGDALKNALDFTGGADVTIAAHSLGNVVVSHAIQSRGYSPTRYFMINAAVPIEAYDLESVDVAQRAAMVEEDWKQRQPRLYAGNWHELFATTPSDRRNELRWKRRFQDVAAIAYNFYSPGEDVVANVPETATASVGALVLNQGFDFARGAWKAQELVKGVTWTTSLAALFMERGQGGWDLDLAYIFVSPENITDEQLKIRPYFDEFREEDLMHTNPTIASARASDAKVQYDLLARGIPALSFAAAANPIAVIGAPRNFDMESAGRVDGRWPTEGHFRSGTENRWLHSDFKAVALPYVARMYEAMISKGTLK
jgi:hypothetical protein